MKPPPCFATLPVFLRLVRAIPSKSLPRVDMLSQLSDPRGAAMDSAARQHELVSRAKSGDQVALQILLLGEHSRIQGLIRQLLPSSLKTLIEPEDVMQDVLRLACIYKGSFEPQGEDAVFRWLAEIAKNHVLNLMRGQDAAKRGGGWTRLSDGAWDSDEAVISVLDRLASHRRTPSASAAAHELVMLVDRLLADLPQEQRMVIERRFLRGESVAETAAALERSEAAVKMLCSRGLAALREALLTATDGA